MSAAPLPVPPQPPWRPLDPINPPVGYVTVYLSNPQTRVPVRDVTRVGDNKSDPNIETGTYGLFSTCQRRTRAGIVDRRAGYLFFMTTWARTRERVITGYYQVGWWAEGTLYPAQRDFALAAAAMRWVDPLPVKELTGSLRRPELWSIRGSRRLTPGQTAELLEALHNTSDRTDMYRAELDRMEKWNAFRTGFRYTNFRRQNPFTREDASRVLAGTGAKEAAPRNSSPGGRWRCVECGEAVTSGALLKVCPICRALASLRPLEE